jgi:amidase
MLAGELTSRDLVEAYLQRVAAYDQAGPRLNTVVNLDPSAPERAAELDAHLARTGALAGPLHGIPLAIKDCIETRGTPTTFGSIATGDYRATKDATVVRRLRAAGAIVLAKTTLPDWTASFFSYSSRTGDTRNPYAPERDAGGSSAGSAAAVAANLATAGIGTDCGGSIRVPASFNCLVGVRSTPGLVSRSGSPMLIEMQDTLGPLTRTMADAAALMDVLVGHDPEDPYTATAAIARRPQSYRDAMLDGAAATARIGVVRDAFGAEDDPESAAVNRVVAGALEAFREAGATLVDVGIPDLRAALEETSLYLARTRHEIDAFLAARPELPVRTLREIHARGLYDARHDLIDAAVAGPNEPDGDPDVLRRYLARERFTRRLVNLLAVDGLDALAFPSVRVLAPRSADPAPRVLTYPTNTLIASQAAMPAVSVPAGFTPAGFPVGVELVAKPYDEPALFRLGYAFERSTAARRPPLITPGLTASTA